MEENGVLLIDSHQITLDPREQTEVGDCKGRDRFESPQFIYAHLSLTHTALSLANFFFSLAHARTHTRAHEDCHESVPASLRASQDPGVEVAFTGEGTSWLVLKFLFPNKRVKATVTQTYF